MSEDNSLDKESLSGRIDKKAKYLRDQLDSQINGFKKRRENNRKNAFWLKISITVLGSIITILLGLKISGAIDLFASIALVLSGLITILNTLESFFDYRTLWLRYTITSTQLLSIKSDLDYLLLSDLNLNTEKGIDELYKRYTNVLTETNESWLGVRKNQAEGQSNN